MIPDSGQDASGKALILVADNAKNFVACSPEPADRKGPYLL